MNDTDMNRTIRTGDARRQEAGHDARQQARREARKKKTWITASSSMSWII